MKYFLSDSLMRMFSFKRLSWRAHHQSWMWVLPFPRIESAKIESLNRTLTTSTPTWLCMFCQNYRHFLFTFGCWFFLYRFTNSNDPPLPQSLTQRLGEPQLIPMVTSPIFSVRHKTENFSGSRFGRGSLQPVFTIQVECHKDSGHFEFEPATGWSRERSASSEPADCKHFPQHPGVYQHRSSASGWHRTAAQTNQCSSPFAPWKTASPAGQGRLECFFRP